MVDSNDANPSGKQQPTLIPTPGTGQVWVSDYPLPPAIEENYRRVEIYADKQLIADSSVGFRVLATANAPTYYLPGDDVAMQALVQLQVHSHCQWKGKADYWALRDDPQRQAVAWRYQQPLEAFAPLAGCFAFYAAPLRCLLDGERVQPQPGDFSGGWVTRDITGPFKDANGSADR